MKITLVDKSNYFKGLLVLIRRDRQVTGPEIELMKRVGKALGFEKEFCENAIRDILENAYIPDSPPQFSSKELARHFIKDGIVLSACDHEPHPSEEVWLQSALEANGLDRVWYEHEREEILKRGESAPLEAEHLLRNS